MRLPGIGGDAPKPARTAHDLYRDLSDRHLLPVPVALLALIVAVPLFLASSPEPEPAPEPPDAEIAARAALETEAVVVRQPVGLRDYRRRLSGLTRSDPFSQQYRDAPTFEEAIEAIEGAIGREVDVGETVTASGGGGDGGAGGADRSPAPSGSDARADRGGGGETPSRRVETKFFEFVADVSMRLEGGRVALRRGVRPLDLLPTENTALTTYLGSTPDLSVATFLVAPGSRGELNGGECLPSPERCEFLRLRPGGIARLSVPIEDGADGRRVIFELRLDRLRSVEADAPAKTSGNGPERRTDPMRDAIEKRAGSSARDLWQRLTGREGVDASQPDGGAKAEDSEDPGPVAEGESPLHEQP